MEYRARQPASAAMAQAKGLIYQHGSLPMEAERKGTKGPPFGAAPQAVPFATADAPGGEMYPQAADFHLINRNGAVTGKAGADGFEASVYLLNRQDNAKNMAESKMRNYSGGGTPYAVQDVDRNDAYGRDFHLQEHSKQLPDKIGSAVTFDAEVYRRSLAEHTQQQQESRDKNRGSAGGAPSGASCPFATSDSNEFREQWQRADYTAKAAGKTMTEKVGAQRSFDAGVYSQAIATNRTHQAAASQHNFVGSGDILAFQSD